METGFLFDIAEDLVGESMPKRHYHSSFEVYYMKSGECHYFIDCLTYEIKEGDIVLIPEGVIHKTVYGDTRHTRLLVNCPLGYVPESVRKDILSLGYVYRNKAVNARLEAIMARIAEEYKSRCKHRDSMLECLSGELFYLLASYPNEYDMKKGELGFVWQTVKYIKENYMHELSLADMARMHSVSPEHLSRSFKKETGLGFTEYLSLRRLRSAEIMLKSRPELTVSEIAVLCGFNDSNYFSDRFKRYFGVSPSAMRKSADRIEQE